MRPKVFLEPVTFLPIAESSEVPQDYAVFVDRAEIAAVPAGWPCDATVVFKATKASRNHLMTPEAHWYGPEAYGVLIRHDRTHGEPVPWKANDRATGGVARKMTMLLCRRDGGALPEMSDQWYPSRTRVVVPVDLGTFQRFVQGSWVSLAPNDLSDTRNPPEKRLYSDAVLHRREDQDSVNIVAEDQKRNHRLACGTVVKYGIAGTVLYHKIVRPPLSRDAGYHTAPGALSRDRAQRSVYGAPVNVKTRKYVLPDQDFVIGGVAIRVSNLSKHGFRGYRLHTG